MKSAEKNERNLEKLAKNTQVSVICHINVKRSQETGNRQTDRQTDKQSTVTLVCMRRALIMQFQLRACKVMNLLRLERDKS